MSVKDCWMKFFAHSTLFSLVASSCFMVCVCLAQASITKVIVENEFSSVIKSHGLEAAADFD